MELNTLLYAGYLTVAAFGNPTGPREIVRVAALAFATFAGTYVASVRMPDGTVVTFELASVPKPDEHGMYRFHNRNGGDIIVHVSNVWIEEKSKKGKAKVK